MKRTKSFRQYLNEGAGSGVEIIFNNTIPEKGVVTFNNGKLQSITSKQQAAVDDITIEAYDWSQTDEGAKFIIVDKSYFIPGFLKEKIFGCPYTLADDITEELLADDFISKTTFEIIKKQEKNFTNQQWFEFLSKKEGLEIKVDYEVKFNGEKISFGGGYTHSVLEGGETIDNEEVEYEFECDIIFTKNSESKKIGFYTTNVENFSGTLTKHFANLYNYGWDSRFDDEEEY